MQRDFNNLFYFSDQTNITQAWKPFYTEFPREATSCGSARNSMCPAETNTNVCLHETNMLSLNSFWHSMTTNWSTMPARAEMEQVKLEEFNLKGMKSMGD